VSEIEQALIALGRELDLPAPRDLAPLVLERLRPQPRRRRRRSWAVAVAVGVLAALAATFAIPQARSAFLRVLHLGSERIQLVDELPPVTPAVDLESALGLRVSLADARKMARPALLELDDPPDRVYVDASGTVWSLYGTPDRVRLLVAQSSELTLDRPVAVEKLVGPGTHVEDVSVDGSPGLFLTGAPHVVILVDRLGNPMAETARLARDVLVWSTGRVTYRLEGDFNRAEAVKIARSLRVRPRD
jgi:hypothetical protein